MGMDVKAYSVLLPPRLRTDEERSASWLELFFDLVFVVAIAQLALALADDLSPVGFTRFLLLFVPVWWSWVGYTNYADRFDTDDPVFRAMMIFGMLAMAVLAVSVPDAFSGGSEAFALSYVAVRVLLILLYERARRNVPAARALISVTMGVFVFGAALWSLSLLVAEPWRFGLWGLALVIEGATPWVARRAMASVPYHASHLPERYGLFTIIVLGESLVAVVLGIGGAHWRFASAFAAFGGFLVAACLWWVYFDFIELADIKRNLLARNVFIYGHLAIALGLTTVGVGVKKAILYSGESHLPAGGSWALCGGTALFLAGIGLIYALSTPSFRPYVLIARTGTAGVAVLLAVVGLAVSSTALVGLLLVAMLMLVAFEAAQKTSQEEISAPTATRDTDQEYLPNEQHDEDC
jgi:low temperature requirement protein LtrA